MFRISPIPSLFFFFLLQAWGQHFFWVQFWVDPSKDSSYTIEHLRLHSFRICFGKKLHIRKKTHFQLQIQTNISEIADIIGDQFFFLCISTRSTILIWPLPNTIGHFRLHLSKINFRDERKHGGHWLKVFCYF